MNGMGKMHPTFIKNDRYVSLYMLAIDIDGLKPTLRIHVNVRSVIEPTNSFNDNNDSIGNERLGDHSKESLEFKNKCPATAVILDYDIDFEKWSRAHFPDNRYDVMTTNIAESFNVMLIDEREYHVASIFNLIAKRFGEFFREWHAYILKSMGNQMVPPIEKSQERKLSRVTSYMWRTKYDLIKIHYAHVMVAWRSKHGNEYGMSIYEYSSPLYKVESYLLSYLDSINVVPLELKWCVPEELINVKIIPPLVDTKLERKQRKRVDENFKSKRRNKCSICKRIGHKRTTCVNNNKS
ncbi:hypothetical protein H5410_026415 [Solanum commersonii]|uniref:Uncharacterized protein n=1 Tax=Solanum commersonii TaxID=4109 RepID=A0A9J5YW26_SOLCO|nr:hypothetical protein H5410_026415 [Solanum commersonii]